MASNSAADAPFCKRPGCSARVFRTDDPDVFWCLHHGEQYVAAPVEYDSSPDRAGMAKSRRDVNARPAVR